jgi:hypothetical protein
MTTLRDESGCVLEAIVEEDGRPVVFVIDDEFDVLPDPWTQLNADPVRSRIQRADAIHWSH